MVLIAPVFYAVGAFIFTAIVCWLYNAVAKRIGGIEFELSGESSASAASPSGQCRSWRSHAAALKLRHLLRGIAQVVAEHFGVVLAQKRRFQIERNGENPRNATRNPATRSRPASGRAPCG